MAASPEEHNHSSQIYSYLTKLKGEYEWNKIFYMPVLPNMHVSFTFKSLQLRQRIIQQCTSSHKVDNLKRYFEGIDLRDEVTEMLAGMEQMILGIRTGVMWLMGANTLSDGFDVHIGGLGLGGEGSR